MKMLRASLFLLASAILLAQPAKKAKQAAPPAAVDRALRARITEFLNYHVTGEFRKAEALVAEDTKDLFYNRNKVRYISCKGISSIRYSDKFTRAYAVVQCTVPMMMQASDNEEQKDTPQELMGPPTVPIPSTWKLENGKWCWYVDPEMDGKMPWGTLPNFTAGTPMPPGAVLPMVTMPPGAAAPPVPSSFGGAAQPSAMDPTMIAALKAAAHVPVTDATFGPVSEEALNHVKLDSTSVSLKAGGEAKIKISNESPDARALMVLGQLTGIEYKLEAASIDGGKSTNLTFKAAAGAQSGTIQLVVATTGEMLPIQVNVK
jgi:hypothetical protein